MVTIYIDQKPIEVAPEQNVLEGVLMRGLNLPYFCWHPALGSVGSCRQCAIQQFNDENDTQGRMVMACMTPVKEGARFSIEHPNAEGFRKSVIEWMMVNHPHDCPVCDEGGECHLQDMTVMTGHNSRKYRFKKRTFQNQNLGPNINHEMNRCITCYRCVRFYKDVAHGSDLHAFAQSGRVYFGRFQEGKLESQFSGNLVEVCPTGVFTDKPFHEQHIRKWDLETAPSICQQCSLGCNISPGARYAKLRRVQNRYHHDINGYFICDKGRFGHSYVNSEDRLTHGVVQGKKTPIAEALGQARMLLKKATSVIGVGSPKASLEANWILQKLVGKDHFYEASSDERSRLHREALDCLKEYGDKIASLRDIREADCILLVGENVQASAPMIELSIRQAHQHFAEEVAFKDQGISSWNDAAVRDYARGNLLPLMIAHEKETSLDGIAQIKANVAQKDLGFVLDGLLACIEHKPLPESLSPSNLAFVKAAHERLSKAKRAVIIAGVHSEQVGACKKAMALAKTLSAKLSLVVSDVNTIGLHLLNPKPTSAWAGQNADLAIALDSDVAHIDPNAIKAKELLVLSSLASDLVNRATIALPCLTFAESTGSVISNEGRLQRYFSVYKSTLVGVEAPFRMLISLDDSLKEYTKLDHIDDEIARDLGLPKSIFECLYQSDFRLHGKKIARDTTEYSGRTAMYAHVNIHEQKPPADPDSPLVYSMEGARGGKIPLPLISSSWEPKWNSVQSSFLNSLNARHDKNHEGSGIRLFDQKERGEGRI